MNLDKSCIYLLVFMGIALVSCSKDPKRFELINPERSGIYFSNTITETDSIHYFNFPYIYNGAGVGVADFNKDGLTDIFFAGNMVSSRLYLNKGSFRFEDISKKAGVTTTQWATGVSVVDINQDGWPDIYLCVGGYAKTEERKNKLFINNRDLTFTESASEYGIADSGHSTQAAFFDYDRDGDLDLYVMNHANEPPASVNKLYTLKDGSGPSTDHLYENIGIGASGHPYYKDVSGLAGIQIEGYGLGLAISDINQDGWPDIYVANDFVGNDLLYINNRDGTFTNKLEQYMEQTSRNGMGVDISDINNDGLQDILVMDMLPESNKRQKTMTSNMNFEHFKYTLKKGFSPQFIRNTLQLNRGIGPNGEPSFSEIGRLTGLYQTDWSWSALIADFDNDGLKDVYITNGYKRDITDHDFQEYSNQANVFENGGRLKQSEILKRLLKLNSIYLPNYMFKNRDSLQFVDETKNWGMGTASLSNGAAYADFDNDGDLDLVVSNLDAPAFLYENKTNSMSRNHYLNLRFEGIGQNKNGIGTKITAYLSNGKQLYYENYPVKGYMSSSATGIQMGIGEYSQIDSLGLVWPDGTDQLYIRLKADTTYLLKQNGNSPLSKRTGTSGISNTYKLESGMTQKYLLENISGPLKIKHRNIENDNNDFRSEPLLLHMYDNNGPGIASGDVDGDGRTDFYIGGSKNQAGEFFIQKNGGTFLPKILEGSDKYEDLGALFFDADQDGDLDLYVVSGGSDVKYFDKGDYQDRLYSNDGKGNFKRNIGALPPMDASGSCVVAADYDNDGDLDLFVGGMIVPGNFPVMPRSYLLENERGTFVDRTSKLAPELFTVGMVNAALWTDYDNDNDKDLMVAGEWMPITLFENKEGKFTKPVYSSGLDRYQGWWNSLVGADLDHDGDIDYVAGNLGDNTAYKASFDQPMRVYAKDFDKNSSIDVIITRYVHDKEVPIAPRGLLSNQLKLINKVYQTYADYAESDIHKLLGMLDTANMQILEANYFKSSYIENLGNGKFKVRPLPLEAQFAPLFGLQITDLNSDGYLDILGIGNYRPTEVISGWYDAGKGIVLQGFGNGKFKFLPIPKTGFVVDGDARALAQISMNNNESIWIATVNSDSTLVYKKSGPRPFGGLKFRDNEVGAEVRYKNGKSRRLEKYEGNGYLSQSSNDIQLDSLMESVKFYNLNGITRILKISD